MKLLILFIICNIANVIIQTIKSICTVKASRIVAAAVNAVAYGFYTYIIILTTCELPLIQKMVIVGLCNFIGVFLVKTIEMKLQKESLWKFEVTFKAEYSRYVINAAEEANLPHTYIGIGKYMIFNFFCATSKESEIAENIIKQFNGKYFVSKSAI